MISRPNTYVDVFRDADADSPTGERDVDAYGDEVDTPRSADAPFLAREPALIVSEQILAASDGNVRTVRRPIARMRPDLDVRAGDRLRDLDGSFYSVETVQRPRFSPTRLLDVRLELTRTS